MNRRGLEATAEVLRGVGVPAAVMDAVAAEAVPFAAPERSSLFQPGDACPGYLLLADGHVRVTVLGASGREALLYRVGPGEICVQTFQCLVEDRRYAAFGTTEAAVSGLLLSPAAFGRRLAESAPFRDFVLRQVAHRFVDLTAAVERTAFTPLTRRLAAALLANREGDTVALTHAALAVEIGSVREVVSRQLDRLARDGIVALERQRIRLRDPAALARLAAGET